MHLQPIMYVTNMERSVEWYSRLLGCDPSFVNEHWTPYDVGGATLALHHHDEPLPAGNVELSLVSDERLEDIKDRMAAVADVIEQPFGRSVIVVDPDGSHIQINEHSS